MKNKNPVSILTVILCLVALFIPTYIAIGSFISGPADEYENAKREITSIEITDTDKKVYSYNKGEDPSGVIGIFKNIMESSTKVSMLTDVIRATPAYTVKTICENGESLYRFYFSTTGASYYEDENGNAYGISKEKCVEFFRTECALSLFYNTKAPVLKNAYNNEIKATSLTWKYRDYDGNFVSAPVSVGGSEATYELDGAFSLSFDIEPTYTKAVLYKGDTVLYDGALNALSSSVTVNSATTYKLVIEAKWMADDAKDYCGEATYSFTTNVEAQANFSLGATKVEAGQIAVINATNVKDPSLISLSISPALKYNGEEIKVSFCGENGSYSALIAIPASAFVDNAQSGSLMNYTIDITYGAAKYTLNLDVKDRTSVQTKTGNATEADIAALRTDSALSAFKQLLKDTASKSAKEKLWKAQKFFSYYNDGYNFSLAYGRNWELVTGTKYRNEFIQYKMKANSSVLAVKRRRSRCGRRKRLPRKVYRNRSRYGTSVLVLPPLVRSRFNG